VCREFLKHGAVMNQRQAQVFGPRLPDRRLLGDAVDRTIVADQRGKANGQIVGTRLEVVTK
jgi:hypothetical protein